MHLISAYLCLSVSLTPHYNTSLFISFIIRFRLFFQPESFYISCNMLSSLCVTLCLFLSLVSVYFAGYLRLFLFEFHK
jgi:hypothetical protein